ncbi:MAG TPA: isoprenylcysteine carboxylmethyltransferase family protein [Gemmatimonadales bacterium]
MPKDTDAARVRVFPPGVPLIVVLLGMVLQRFRPILPDLSLPAAVRYGLGGLIVLGSILGLGFRAVRTMRRTGQDENPWKPSPSLIETGPYRITRNPMYLQLVLVCIGFSVLLANPWILVLTPPAALVLQELAIRPEEEYLERKFGEDYRAYKRRVRRWI